MYKDHLTFKAPEDKNSKIWRYMDFTKFVPLLNSESLFFLKEDKFDNQFEDYYPRLNVESRKNVPNNQSIIEQISYKYLMEQLSELNQQWTKYIAIPNISLNKLK